jgi:hypothetical protein
MSKIDNSVLMLEAELRKLIRELDEEDPIRRAILQIMSQEPLDPAAFEHEARRYQELRRKFDEAKNHNFDSLLSGLSSKAA